VCVCRHLPTMQKGRAGKAGKEPRKTQRGVFPTHSLT